MRARYVVWVATERCYQFRYTVKDVAGNSVTYTSADTTRVAMPVLAFATSWQVVAESAGALEAVVELSGAAPVEVIATFVIGGSASRPQDHDLAPGTVVIPAGSTSGRISFVVYDDPLPESDETLVIALQTVTGATLGAQQLHQVVIRDNDSAQVGGVTAIAAGMNSTCAIVDGGAKCWGANGLGQLGDGTTRFRSHAAWVNGLTAGVTAIAAGQDHACAIIVNGALRCWGSNSNGQLGDGTTTQRTSPVQVTGLTAGVTAIVGGQAGHYCAVVNGSARCWGGNSYGSLGDGTMTQRTSPVQVISLTAGVTAIACGQYHTCAVVHGSARCWGRNSFGQLGHEGSNCAEGLTALLAAGEAEAVSSGGNHTCAVVGGAAWCWGSNGNGQLGDGTTFLRTSPVRVLGLTSGVAAIAAGGSHTCAVVNGSARCWGANNVGQLGDGSTN